MATWSVDDPERHQPWTEFAVNEDDDEPYSRRETLRDEIILQFSQTEHIWIRILGALGRPRSAHLGAHEKLQLILALVEDKDRPEVASIQTLFESLDERNEAIGKEQTIRVDGFKRVEYATGESSWEQVLGPEDFGVEERWYDDVAALEQQKRATFLSVELLERLRARSEQEE